MSNLFVITGLPASGKTTLANNMVRERKAILLSEDEWMENICHSYYNEEIKERIVNFQCKVAERLLKIGTSVVMDGGYWSKEERDALACLAENAGATFHLFYIKVPLEELKRRVIERNKVLSSEFQTNIKDLELAYDKFQEPDIISEKFTLVKNFG